MSPYVAQQKEKPLEQQKPQPPNGSGMAPIQGMSPYTPQGGSTPGMIGAPAAFPGQSQQPQSPFLANAPEPPPQNSIGGLSGGSGDMSSQIQAEVRHQSPDSSGMPHQANPMQPQQPLAQPSSIGQPQQHAANPMQQQPQQRRRGYYGEQPPL